VKLTRLRSGELTALVGAILVIVALTRPWYETAGRQLSAWSTFGPAVVLIMIAALGALVLVFTTVTEHSTAFPVASAVWSVLFALIGVIAAIVRVLERPDSATSLCAGAWLALAGTILIFAGSWQSIRDERTSLYPPATPEPRKLAA
jgi:Na+-transporting NADH:ubiquinone oxidoreductase subunit NqrE